MVETKTVAERLRDYALHRTNTCTEFRKIATGTKNCFDIDCLMCRRQIANELADMIEAEQAQAVSKALRGAESQLPEGVIWPTYEDGELVKFGDVAKVREDIGDVIEVRFHTGKCSEVTIAFEGESTATHYMVVDGPHLKRHEPEVLDADGVPIHVGDTVWHEDEGECVVERIYRQNGDTLLDLDVCGASWNTVNVKPTEVTHRKPDTQEAIDADCWVDAKDYCEKYDVKTEWPKHYGKAKCEHLLARQRKLLGGE